MLRFLTALAASVALASAAEKLSVQELALKALEKAVSRGPLIRLSTPEQGTLVCAIPLKEVRAGRSRYIDPLARPAGPETLDPIAHRVPIQACPKR